MPVLDKNGFIVGLEHDEVFTFGSNLAGRHGAGAALQAVRHFGARYGVGFGLCGRTFALPTKDERINTLSLVRIKMFVSAFCNFTLAIPNRKFIVTRIGTGLAGISDREMAEMFAKNLVNTNVYFDKEWRRYIPVHSFFWN